MKKPTSAQIHEVAMFAANAAYVVATTSHASKDSVVPVTPAIAADGVVRAYLSAVSVLSDAPGLVTGQADS